MSKRILFVEDDGLFSRAATGVIERAGYHVTAYPTGEAALEQVRDGLQYDLALVDDDLGKGMEGHQLAAELKKMYPGRPVVYLTGTGLSPPGGDGMIVKTVDTETLVRIIERRIGPGGPTTTKS